MGVLEKFQAHNQQFKKKKRKEKTWECQQKWKTGINDNFKDVKIYHVALFYSPLQNVGIQNVVLKDPS